jgi:hypothetical protein
VAGRLWKVQYKSGRLGRNGAVVIVGLMSYRRTRDGYVRKRYAEHEVDLIAVYCEELGRCFLLPVSLTAGLGPSNFV